MADIRIAGVPRDVTDMVHVHGMRRPVAQHLVAVQHDEELGADAPAGLHSRLISTRHNHKLGPSEISSTSIRMVERGMKSMGLARGRKGRSPVASPSPAMLWMGWFCNSRPVPLSTMLYLKSMPQSFKQQALCYCGSTMGWITAAR